MSNPKLFSNLANIYHILTPQIVDIKHRSNIFIRYLKKYNCNKILEIGCGTGLVTKYLADAGFDIIGFDLSKDMLKIAQKYEPRAKYIQGDMRKLIIKDNFDAILITGVSFSHLTTNKDVLDTLTAIEKIMDKKTLFMMDNFYAEDIFRNFDEKIHIKKVSERDIEIVQENKRKLNLKTGFTWDWYAKYKIHGSKGKKVVEDISTLRAYTHDEIRTLLCLANMKIIKILSDKDVFYSIIKKN